jgi:putative endonuclease
MRQRDDSPPPAWSVYLLRCADGTLYCGATNDVDRRLAAHGRGRVKYTRGRLPVELAHVERAADKGDALRREAAWKRLRRAEKLRRIACAKAGDPLCALDEINPSLGIRLRAPRLRLQR